MRRFLWDDEEISVERVDEALEGSLFTWIVCDGAQRIGYCGLRRVPDGDGVELLYSVEPEHWGAGVATAAAEAVLAYGFSELGLDRILAGADAPNAASFAVMRRLGMRRISPPGARTVYFELKADS